MTSMMCHPIHDDLLARAAALATPAVSSWTDGERRAKPSCGIVGALAVPGITEAPAQAP